jgi:hypothetical protein
MSNPWEEYYRCLWRWQAAGDRERLLLADLFHEGFACHETDTERSFALLTQGRQEAERLQEPWWVLFFDSWRLTSLTSHAEDYTRALPLAMSLMVQVHSPAGRQHEWRYSIMTEVLNTFLSIDPVGYRDELERGFAALEDDLLEEDRLVLNYRRNEYLMYTERPDEAHEGALRNLAQALAAPDPSKRIWHGAWNLYQLCSLCATLGKMDQVAGHAEHLEELSRQHGQLRRTLAASFCWRAVTELQAGNEKKASSHVYQGLRVLSKLVHRDTICADPLARYYEVKTDLRAALQVRERELPEVTRRGMLQRAGQLHLERCRLRLQLRELTAADRDAAREAIGKLRVPGRFLEMLALIGSE